MKEKKSPNPKNSYYCKVCRMWYLEENNLSKFQHLTDHKSFIEELLNEVDIEPVPDENISEELQKN